MANWTLAIPKLSSVSTMMYSPPSMFLIAYRQLTKSLLKRDFGLKLELPDDRLCPPVCDILGTWLRETKVLCSRSPTGLLVSFFPPVPASLI